MGAVRGIRGGSLIELPLRCRNPTSATPRSTNAHLPEFHRGAARRASVAARAEETRRTGMPAARARHPRRRIAPPPRHLCPCPSSTLRRTPARRLAPDQPGPRDASSRRRDQSWASVAWRRRRSRPGGGGAGDQTAYTPECLPERPPERACRPRPDHRARSRWRQGPPPPVPPTSTRIRRQTPAARSSAALQPGSTRETGHLRRAGDRPGRHHARPLPDPASVPGAARAGGSSSAAGRDHGFTADGLPSSRRTPGAGVGTAAGCQRGRLLVGPPSE
jgi:hypothetical protein